MAMPAATAALTLRVEPNCAIETVNSAPALASGGDTRALLTEDQQAVPRQRSALDARRAGHVVDRDDRQSRIRGEGQQFGGRVVMAQPLIAIGHHGASAVPAALADDVHGVDGERVGGAHDGADVRVVAEVLDRHVQRVPALVDVGDDRFARPVSVCVNDIAGVAVAQQSGSYRGSSGGSPARGRRRGLTPFRGARLQSSGVVHNAAWVPISDTDAYSSASLISPCVHRETRTCTASSEASGSTRTDAP